jgi:hypothetical protein
VIVMYRSPLRDIPPFDKAPVFPQSIFIPDEWGFGSVAAVWRDWRRRRRERRLRRKAVARR